MAHYNPSPPSGHLALRKHAGLPNSDALNSEATCWIKHIFQMALLFRYLATALDGVMVRVLTARLVRIGVPCTENAMEIRSRPAPSGLLLTDGLVLRRKQK